MGKKRDDRYSGEMYGGGSMVISAVLDMGLGNNGGSSEARPSIVTLPFTQNL